MKRCVRSAIPVQNKIQQENSIQEMFLYDYTTLAYIVNNFE